MKHPIAVLVPFALVALALCGCPQPKPPATFVSDEHGHSHERDHMKFVDVGDLPYHAGLTAHLSQKDGNELDVFFETADDAHKPVPMSLVNFAAAATTADGKQHMLKFEPAPKDERKDDPDGKCSHFVAKAGWMKPDDVLTVTAPLLIDGKHVKVVWKDFNPKKYAHHID